jgi:hypothetical protein
MSDVLFTQFAFENPFDLPSGFSLFLLRLGESGVPDEAFGVKALFQPHPLVLLCASAESIPSAPGEVLANIRQPKGVNMVE